MKLRKTAVWVTVIAIAVILSVVGTTYIFGVGPFNRVRTKLVVSTTTSIYDTGLLDVIEDHFEEKYLIDIHFISAGTGIAIEYAKRGDADMILVHSPSLELGFLEGGYGVCRKIFAYNFFSIVGPVSDQANIDGTTVTQALRKIIKAGRNGEATWISRGDNSGTHTKEKSLWNNAGFDWNIIRYENWYVESGTGMVKTLQIANEKKAYTLADIGTYLKYYKDKTMSIKILVEQGSELLNVYSAVAVDKIYNPEANFDAAISLIKFLVSNEGQQIIGGYGEDTYGGSLFNQVVQLMTQNTDPVLVQWVESYAYFDGSECPLKYQNNHKEMYN